MALTEVRLALVGFGRWGGAVERTLRAIDGATLAAVAVARPEQPRLLPPGCTVHGDWRAVVSSPTVDALIVVTGPDLHAEPVLAALAAGKPVLVEKPMTTSVPDAQRVVRASRENRGIVHVDHIDLANPAWRTLVGALPGIGPVKNVTAEFGADTASRHAPARWDWGPHPVALCASLFGRPAVSSARRTHGDEGGVEVVEIELAFASGIRGRLAFGDAFPDRRRRFSVCAAQGTLCYDDNAPQKVVLERAGAVEALPVAAAQPLEVVLRRFVAAVRDGRPDYSDAELGLQVVEVLSEVDALLSTAKPQPLPPAT